jgi:hypothetical protein
MRHGSRSYASSFPRPKGSWLICPGHLRCLQSVAGRSLEEINEIFVGSKSIFDPPYVAKRLIAQSLAHFAGRQEEKRQHDVESESNTSTKVDADRVEKES